jgi:uncharacterized protein (TIGR02611 family)
MTGGGKGRDRARKPGDQGGDAEQAAGVLQRIHRRVAAVRARVIRRPGGLQVWRIAVAVIGSLVIAAGIVLLVTPGPGWLVIFLGLGIWATEFMWARSLLEYVQRQVRKWTAWIARQPRWRAVVIGAIGVIAFVVVIGFLLI